MPNKQELEEELKHLNQIVDAAIKQRTEWMDAHMVDFAKWKVGDKLYVLSTGEYLGAVSSLYRFWGKQKDPRYDTSMDIEYEFTRGDNIFDNTSRQPNLRIGTLEEREAWLERELGSVRRA